jgi:inner membrane protein
MDSLQLVFLAIGSVLPDIDHPQGLIYQFLETPEWLSKGISGLAQRHRGPTHTLLAAIAFMVASLLFANVYLRFDVLTSIMLFLGYVSHLLSDSLTRSGIAWLSPFNKKVTKWIIRTGGKSERYFLTITITLLLFIKFPQTQHLCSLKP